MKFQFISYIIPLLISFIILMSLAVYGYKHRSVRGARAFTICMLIGSLWALGNGLEMAGVELATKLFWANLQYIAYTFAPVVWLVMVLQFTDRADWINRRNILIMSIIPVVTIILVWTDPLYGLVRTNFALDTSGAFSVINKDYGPFFWVHFGYCYLLNFATVIFLFRALLLKNTVYHKQALHLLVGFLVIGVCNIFYVTGFSPVEGIDLSPISFSISGIIIGRGIFHFRLFDLVPIARATVIEKMGSGIIVIDNMKRIIDINPQAVKMLGLSRDADIGQNLYDILPELNKFIPSEPRNSLIQKELTLNNNDVEIHYYELYLSPLRDFRKKLIAWVIILNDITDLKKAREQISQQKQELAVMDERERMARDLHDNLGQILSFSNVQIQAVREELKKDNQQLADRYLQRLTEIIKDAHKDIREYVYNIRDDSDYKKDFSFLLAEEIKEFKERSDLKTELLLDRDITLDIMGTEEKVQLLYTVKEALTNTLKHAEADTVRISLNKKEQSAELIIADNGKGIPASINRGSGLNIMNERARLIGGEFNIESQPGKGTKIIVDFPV
ncbi:MAG: histidine kinase N-terminal 7TM domain-containing protein [Halanaerobiaceae bacterium]